MNILRLNAYHGDSAACLFVDGKLVAAAEAERFRRIRRWAGLPPQAIDYCLREAGLTINEVNHIGVNRNSHRWQRHPSYESKLQMEAGRLGISSAVLKPDFLSGVDKAAARTGGLVAGHSYMARVGASDRRQNHRAMFFSISVSEPDYAYILRRCW
jgi:predicted NodU family carbamoyl transferase